MKEPVKLLTRDWFHQHPVKEHSAARLEYSMLLMPEAVSSVDKMLPALRGLAAQRGIALPDATQQMVALEQEEDTGRLLRMLRQTLAPDVRGALLEKLLKREAEALPEIRRLILKTFNDNAIENCVRFMARCEENCSQWIFAELRRCARTLWPFHAVSCAWLPRQRRCHSVSHAPGRTV